MKERVYLVIWMWMKEVWGMAFRMKPQTGHDVSGNIAGSDNLSVVDIDQPDTEQETSYDADTAEGNEGKVLAEEE